MQARRIQIDALKAVGSHMIVLHHLVAYGPVSDALAQALPALMGWLFDYGRMAVQIFLVLGGYLAVAALEPTARARTGSLPQTLLRRYQRLVLPFLVAVLICMATAEAVRPWLTADLLPGPPTWSQVLAHVFLLHSVLDFDSLSAGAGYVAMDFQLFAVMAVLLHLGYHAPGLPRLAHWLVVGLMLASLFYFNRFVVWDAWALYFFGAYGLGAAARWIGRSRYPEVMLILLVVPVACALWLEFRARIALALAVAVLLGLAQWAHVRSHHWPEVAPPVARVVHALGKISYALFLIHFPVLLLGNAVFTALNLSGPEAAGALLLACWAASVVAAIAFARWVEAPLAHWGYKRSLLSPRAGL